jgi:hypothetical protein
MATKKRSSKSRAPASTRRPGPDRGGVPARREVKVKVKEPDARLPDPGSDAFAFLVAEYAWRDGLTANAIVRRLKLSSTPQHLMQVKRALKRAYGHFLQLLPPRAKRLQDDLDLRVNVKERRRNAIRFHVVEDEWGPAYGPVCACAAELVSEIIREATRRGADRPPARRPESGPDAGGRKEPDVVICNAGGRTISEMVRAMLRDPPVVDESEERSAPVKDRLLFVAGNAAYLPDQFHRSANFLSVTMSELFGAEHLALPMVEAPGFPRHYEDLVDHASLFICGVGSLDSGLMSKFFADRGWPIPGRAVGDLAFNLLDERGDAVELPEEARGFMNQVNPGLKLPKLMRIAANQRVLLIFDSEPPEAKTPICVAALRREYATDVVLGSRLARAILREY